MSKQPQPTDRLQVYQLALEESRLGFDDLMQQPERIRRNVGALLGFAAVSVTLFGVGGAKGSTLTSWHVAAIIPILGLAVCTVAVLRPRKLIPSMDADEIVKWADEGDSIEGAVRNLARSTAENYRSNAKVIEKMFRWQIGAAVCFGLTAVLLATQASAS